MDGKLDGWGSVRICFVVLSLLASPLRAGETYRLYPGLTAYVNNPAGTAFSIEAVIRDINTFAGGPREVLFKVYDPDGQPGTIPRIPRKTPRNDLRGEGTS